LTLDELADEFSVELTDELTGIAVNDGRRQTGAAVEKRELIDALTVTDKLADVALSTSDESEEAALYTDPDFKKRQHALLLVSLFLAEGSW
jgi:hypothetical protein